MLPIEGVVAYLQAKINEDADFADVRVYGEEFPVWGEGIELRRVSEIPAVCVRSTGGFRRDVLSLEVVGMCVDVIAENFRPAHLLQRVVRDALDDIAESGAGAPYCLKSAVRMTPPNAIRSFRDRWYLITTDWTIYASADAPPA